MQAFCKNIPELKKRACIERDILPEDIVMEKAGADYGKQFFKVFLSINACDLQSFVYTTKGVFLVKMKNAFEPVKRDYSVNTYSRISTVPRGSE